LFHFSIAVAAINRSVVAGLERNLRFFSASCACGREELTGGLGRIFLCVAAGLASLRLVLEALFSIEFLFSGCENEFRSAILAYQCLVLIHVCYLALNKWF
jgi:hypothetical protein